jgi:hypothetical protein
MMFTENDRRAWQPSTVTRRWYGGVGLGFKGKKA